MLLPLLSGANLFSLESPVILKRRGQENWPWHSGREFCVQKKKSEVFPLWLLVTSSWNSRK